MAASARVKSLDEGKSPEVLYREKVKRALDVAALRRAQRGRVVGEIVGGLLEHERIEAPHGGAR